MRCSCRVGFANCNTVDEYIELCSLSLKHGRDGGHEVLKRLILEISKHSVLTEWARIDPHLTVSNQAELVSD